MGKHFRPDIYQIADKREQSKEPLQIYPNPLYSVLWTRKTRKFEYTNLFFLSFRVDTDTDQIYEALKKEFDVFFDKIIRLMYWYEIQLKDRLTWGEIIARVDHALDGVVVDVIG